LLVQKVVENHTLQKLKTRDGKHFFLLEKLEKKDQEGRILATQRNVCFEDEEQEEEQEEECRFLCFYNCHFSKQLASNMNQAALPELPKHKLAANNKTEPAAGKNLEEVTPYVNPTYYLEGNKLPYKKNIPVYKTHQTKKKPLLQLCNGKPLIQMMKSTLIKFISKNLRIFLIPMLRKRWKRPSERSTKRISLVSNNLIYSRCVS
jgi:hypothetical protein